jgi:hypothetical protein
LYILTFTFFDSRREDTETCLYHCRAYSLRTANSPTAKWDIWKPRSHSCWSRSTSLLAHGLLSTVSWALQLLRLLWGIKCSVSFYVLHMVRSIHTVEYL